MPELEENGLRPKSKSSDESPIVFVLSGVVNLQDKYPRNNKPQYVNLVRIQFLREGQFRPLFSQLDTHRDNLITVSIMLKQVKKISN